MDALYQEIIESLGSGVLVTTRDDTVRVANSAAARHLDVAEDVVAPGRALAANPVTARLLSVLGEVRERREAIRRRELSLGGRAHDERVIGLTATPLPGEHYNGSIVLFTDLSELRQLERAAALNRQLAQIGELTAGVVHEIRNPLGVIGGNAELLLRKLFPETPLYRAANTIHREAQQLERLVGHFLRFARPFELEFEECAAAQVVNRAMELCDRAITAKNIDLLREVPERLPALRADHKLLAQALANLIGNAADAVEYNGQIRVSVVPEAERLLFRVHDNGPGVHVPEGKDIFSPFYTGKEDGTGLGLAIVHRITSAHRGEVSWENAPEGGAVFTIAVPVRPADRPGE